MVDLCDVCILILHGSADEVTLEVMCRINQYKPSHKKGEQCAQLLGCNRNYGMIVMRMIKNISPWWWPLKCAYILLRSVFVISIAQRILIRIKVNCHKNIRCFQYGVRSICKQWHQNTFPGLMMHIYASENAVAISSDISSSTINGT